MEDKLKERMHWTMEDYKNSEDIVDRTVWLISTLSPHNLWKGYEAIASLLAQNNQVWEEQVEQIIGQDETEYRDSRGVLHAPSSWQKIRNGLRAEQRHRARALTAQPRKEET